MNSHFCRGCKEKKKGGGNLISCRSWHLGVGLVKACKLLSAALIISGINGFKTHFISVVSVRTCTRFSLELLTWDGRLPFLSFFILLCLPPPSCSTANQLENWCIYPVQTHDIMVNPSVVCW